MKKSIFTVLSACVIAIYMLSGCVQGESAKATPGLMSDKEFADTSNSRYWQHQASNNKTVELPSADSSKMETKETPKEETEKRSDSK